MTKLLAQSSVNTICFIFLLASGFHISQNVIMCMCYINIHV